MRVLYYLKWPLVIFLFGSIVRITGALIKIMHWYSADKTLITGTGIMITGLILLIFKLIILKKNGWLPADKS